MRKRDLKNLKINRIFLSLIVILTLTGFLASAKPNHDLGTLNLGTIEVIGERYPRVRESSFASCEVIERADIKRTSHKDISSYMEENTNINLHSGGVGFVSGISIRGISGGTKNNKTKVWLNGCPVNTLRRGFVLEVLPLNSIERIDIIKGPSSVLYGGGALNGSINITSVIPVGESYDINYEGGSYKTNLAGFSLQKRTEDFAYGGDLSYTDTEGFIKDPDSDNKLNPATIVKGGITGEYNIKNNIFTLNARKFNSLKDSPQFSFKNGTFKGVDKNINTGIGIYSLSWQHNFSKFRTSLRGFVNTETEKSDEMSRESSLNTGGVFEVSSDLSENLSGIAGYDWENLYLDIDTKYKDYYQRRLSPFLKLVYDIPRGPSLTAGGRYSINTEFSSRVTPKFGVSWDIFKDINFYGNIAQGYRPPTVGELHSKSLDSFGDPDLNPESSVNYEAGMRYKKRVFKYKMSVYKTIVKDMIVNQPPEETEYNTDGDKIIKKVQNISGTSPYHGVELGATVSAVKNIYFKISYNYLDPGDLTFHTARHRVKTRLGYRTERHSVYLAAVSAFDRYLWDYEGVKRGDYTVLNFKYGVNLTGNLGLYARVDNITDREYYLYFYQPTPGRNYSAGLNISF